MSSKDQLQLNQWTTLLEPKPQEYRKEPPREPPPQEPAAPPVARQDEEPQVYSVSDINALIKGQLEGQFKSIWLQGEISNFKAHTSGHHYFSLKDDSSQISAVMFKGFNGKLKFRPDNGMEVLVRGRVTVYEPRGNYQIFCETMEPVGAGALQKAFEQLKSKLQKEGLFDVQYKKTLPLLPRHIGVVTSPTGAAIQDILNILGRRYRGGKITVIPARVQGEGAGAEVVRGIELANRLGGFDVLIVGRGGGSIEDMWCFNEEPVARAIFASKIPIISAVGHEIDFTIADFVADVRAPTPSAAAELVAQSAGELSERIQNHLRRLTQKMQFVLSHQQSRLQNKMSRLVDPQRRLQDLAMRADELQQRLILAWQRQTRDLRMQTRLLRERLRNPRTVVESYQQKLMVLRRDLQKEIKHWREQRQRRLVAQISLLDSLSPLRVVARGYSLVFAEGQIVKDPQQVKENQELTVQLAQGALRVSVIAKDAANIKGMEESWTSKKN